MIFLTLLATFFVLNSCSTNKVDEVPKVAPLTVEAKPVWFNSPKRFHYTNPNFDIETHAFFDLAPLEDKNKMELSYVLLTPKDSEYGYDINLKSGQFYKKHHYCPQDDVWKTYPGKINYPPFAEGFIPRVMDQFGRPMRVLVFGSQSYFVKDKRENAYSQRAKIIGGVVKQYCSDYPCAGQEKWTSTMVMIGVIPFDPSYENLNTIEDLKNKVNWSEVKAFIENGYGRKLGPPRDEPVYRLVGETSAQDAWKYGFEKGHVFSMKEMNQIRSSCYQLYDAVWMGAKKSRVVTEKRQMTQAELEKRAEELIQYKNDFSRVTVIKDTLIYKDEDTSTELEKVEKGEMKFGDFMKNIYFKHGNRLHTCFEYVRPANIQLDVQRHWFFAFLEAFVNLDKMGHFYLCSRRAWIENPILNNGKRTYGKENMRNCTGEELDLAFDGAITFFAGLRRASRDHYKYIEYDSGIGGSHQKIYSWVFDDGKKLKCPSDFKTSTNDSLFPSDIRWEPFYEKVIKGRGDYIQ